MKGIENFVFFLIKTTIKDCKCLLIIKLTDSRLNTVLSVGFSIFVNGKFKYIRRMDNLCL